MKSNFKYFSSSIFKCFATFKKCLPEGLNKVFEQHNYRFFYWLDSYCDWMRLEPIVHEAIIVLVDKNDTDIKTKWHEKMKHMPVMRIKIVPTVDATGMASFDNIQIIYHDGVDLHDYDEKIEAWKEKVFDKEKHKIKEDARNFYIDAMPEFGRELCSFRYDGDDVYEKEEAIYNGICDGTIFNKLVELTKANVSDVLKTDPLK